MSVVINTNNAARVASNNLAYSNAMLQNSLNPLSSGSKIVNPSDDAGGLAVAMKLSATANRQSALSNNIGDATSLLQTQDGALQVTGQILNRVSELATLYADPTKNTSDKANYDSEFNQLQAELNSLTTSTFNNVSLFGTVSIVVSVTDDLSTGSSAVTLTNEDLANTVGTVGVGNIFTSSITSSLSTLAVTTITGAIQIVATMRAQNGAEQSRLNFASSLLTTNQTNLQSAISRISDVDVAQETTSLAKWNVLVQSGTAMLTQANHSADVALKLITG